jgi:dienelactone hydrolase
MVCAALFGACAVVPQYPASSSTFEGFPVRSYVPADPAGLVFLFHGSGGGTGFADKVETVAMLNVLTARGYGFVATESTDRIQKRWNNTNLSMVTNPDLARLARLHAQLVDTTAVDSDTPLFAVGMSRGAGFSSVFAKAFSDAGYPVAAIAPSHGQVPLVVRAAGGLETPAFFALGANDTVVDNDEVAAQVADLDAAGVPVELRVEPEIALRPSRLQRVDGVDGAEARAVFDALVAEGLYTAAGIRLQPINTVLAAAPGIAMPASITTAQRRDLLDQLNVVLAVHEFSATYAAETADFFTAHGATSTS